MNHRMTRRDFLKGAAAMNEFPAVLFFGVLLLWVPRLGESTNLPLIVTALPLAAAASIVLSNSYPARNGGSLRPAPLSLASG